MRITVSTQVVKKVVKEKIATTHLVVSKKDLLEWLIRQCPDAAKEFAFQVLYKDRHNSFESVDPEKWIIRLILWAETSQGIKYWDSLNTAWQGHLEDCRSSAEAVDIISEDE